MVDLPSNPASDARGVRSIDRAEIGWQQGSKQV